MILEAPDSEPRAAADFAHAGEVGINVEVLDDGTLLLDMRAAGKVRMRLVLTPDQSDTFAKVLAEAAGVARRRGSPGGG